MNTSFQLEVRRLLEARFETYIERIHVNMHFEKIDISFEEKEDATKAAQEVVEKAAVIIQSDIDLLKNGGVFDEVQHKMNLIIPFVYSIWFQNKGTEPMICTVYYNTVFQNRNKD